MQAPGVAAAAATQTAVCDSWHAGEDLPWEAKVQPCFGSCVQGVIRHRVPKLVPLVDGEVQSLAAGVKVHAEHGTDACTGRRLACVKSAHHVVGCIGR